MITLKGGERTMTNERTLSKDKKQRGGISLRNLLNKKLKNEKGLTLIELLAVIVILAIIALIAIPAIGNIISNSKSKAILSDATTIIAGAKTAIADGACGAPEDDKSVTCNEAALSDYVEGLNQPMKKADTANQVAGDKVIKKADGTYEITYTGFSKLNKKYSDELFGEGKTGTTATQKQIAKAMGNN